MPVTIPNTVRIDQSDAVNLLLTLCRADSAPYEEKRVFEIAARFLRSHGFNVREDDAGKKVGGTVGNLIALHPGRGDLADESPLLLSAHMDRVAGGTGVAPIVEGGVVRSDGSTILGADDAAGIAATLAGCRALLQSDVPHRPVEILFTIAEEVGLVGAKNADLSGFESTAGFVLDADGPVGTVIVQAPTEYRVTGRLFGRAAHSGLCPEEGVSAIKMAAVAVSRMQLGRVDGETTANVGYIAGGGPTNVVPETAEIRADARSLSPARAERQVANMRRRLEESARRFGGSAECDVELAYEAFKLDSTSEPVTRALWAARTLDLDAKLLATGGGSDANVFNACGLPSVVLGVGFRGIHTHKECIPVAELVRLSELVAALLRTGRVGERPAAQPSGRSQP